jgi:hypothetical protein
MVSGASGRNVDRVMAIAGSYLKKNSLVLDPWILT